MYVLLYLFCSQPLHYGQEGEKISIVATLELIGKVDEFLEHLGPLRKAYSGHKRGNHQLRETEMSEGSKRSTE